MRWTTGNYLTSGRLYANLGEVREILDPADRSEVLTEAQALLTAFVLMLKPLPTDKVRSSREGGCGQMPMFDAQ